MERGDEEQMRVVMYVLAVFVVILAAIYGAFCEPVFSFQRTIAFAAGGAELIVFSVFVYRGLTDSLSKAISNMIQNHMEHDVMLPLGTLLVIANPKLGKIPTDELEERAKKAKDIVKILLSVTREEELKT